MPEKFSAMRNSGDLNRSPDSVGQNAEKLPLKQLNSIAKQQKNQRKIHEKIDENDHQKADVELENALLSLDVFTNEKELQKVNSRGLDVDSKLSVKERIKTYTESLKGKKSHQEILRLLIAKFENENGAETLVNNFRNYQKLYQFAETKSPKERKAIQNIITKADFSDENAFNTSLAQISKSAEISQETKFEVIKQFGGNHINSVNGMDYQLKQVKNHTKAIEQEIDSKSREQESLNSEINELENELATLPLNSPERQELKEKIEQKKEQFKDTNDEIDRLEKVKPKETSFVLREGFSAKLNSDGSRSIVIDNDFSLKLPSHRLPLTTTRNLRAINMTFPFKILKDLRVADIIFSPKLENNAVPTKSQRDLGHLIFSSLNIDDSRILSEENIIKLRKDLTFLQPKNGKTVQEHLIDLGIYDISSRNIYRSKFREKLKDIKKNK